MEWLFLSPDPKKKPPLSRVSLVVCVLSKTRWCLTCCKIFSITCCPTLLLPTNQVWGKVIFSQACASHSVHRGSLYDVTSCLAAWFHVPSGGSLFLVPYSYWGLCQGGLCQGGLCLGSLCRRVSVQGGLCPRGVSVQGGSLSKGGLCPGVSVQGVSLQRPPINKKAGSMHPTGILSSFVSIFELHGLDNELHCLDHHIAAETFFRM